MANNNDSDTRRQGGPTVRELPIKSGASFKKTDLLIWTATGLDMIANSASYAPTSDTTRIAGKALHGATDPTTGVAYTHADIEVFEPGTLFPIALMAGTSPSLAFLGKGYELQVDAGGILRVNTGANTNPAVRIVSYVKTDLPTWPDTVATSGGALAWCEPLAVACQFAGARVGA